MPSKDIDLGAYLIAAKTAVEPVYLVIKDKGLKRFSKVFMLSGFMIGIAYFGVYMPPQKKISRLVSEVDKARALFESGGIYKDTRAQLVSSYGNLPLLKDQQQWLSNSLIDSLRAEGLTPEAFRPVVEQEVSGLIFQTSIVEFPVKFNELYSWLVRLEGATPMMRITTLKLNKQDQAIGRNTVTATVMTAIPRKRQN